MLRNVVLPEPDGPVTATNSPSSTFIVRSRSAWVSTIEVRYTLDTSFIVNIGGLLVCDPNSFCFAEGVGTRHHDPVAGLRAVEDLDRVEADRADLDGPALGDVTIDEVRDVPAPALEERAALDHDHVRAL